MPVSGSNIVAASDTLDAQIEKVRTKIQELFETSDTVASLIKKGGDVETISNRLYRIPLIKYRGGTYAKVDMDGGDMGSGSGLVVIKVTAGYIESRYTVELSERTLNTTETSGQAVVNAFAYLMKNAMREVQVYDDIAFHTDGTGRLTSSSSATGTWSGGSKRTYTFASAGDPFGVDRLRPGMAVDVYSSDGSTKRSSASAGVQPVVDHIDWDNKVVYLNVDITGAAAGDILAFAGITPPLQSFQSGWPLTGDSFRHGLYYANDDSTSNYYLGQLKANETELLANSVDANNSGFAFAHLQQLIDKIIKRRDESVYKGLVGIAHMAQRSAVFDRGIAISEWQRKGGEVSLDLLPSNNRYSDTFQAAGITFKLSKRQAKNRLDLIVPSLWCRAQLHDAKFHEVQGRTIFESRTSSGTLKAARHFHIIQSYDFACVDPGAAGFVKNLAIPANY